MNPDPRTSRSLNVGLAEASGEYVVRIDARSRVEPHYVQRCVDLLAARPELGVVGGAQRARPRSTRAVDVGIARALRNRWTTGLSRYRRVNESGPADTVWMGAFRRSELVDLGGWDPAVALNEDFELCQRYRAGGAKVWFEVALQSGYVPRADFGSLAKQYFQFGRVKGTWWARGRRPQPRQVLLLAAPVVAGGVFALIGRRIGLGRASVLAGAAVITVEVAGTRDPRGGPSAHAAAAVAIVTSNAAWWVGTVVGFAGETIGVTHRHG